ncbi:hypothetical protein E2C01_086003 [Portunus trituberculatus]|uniref:Uncharacterized protein n=1 Tax=Portunus trituberculatus TaxID=210409 RepID=A0A5B7J8H8_PORTR|nr:hypothetical protein [Portunus trituberculatus]
MRVTLYLLSFSFQRLYAYNSYSAMTVNDSHSEQQNYEGYCERISDCVPFKKNVEALVSATSEHRAHLRLHAMVQVIE